MSKASNISTLSALRERKEEIKAEQEVARRGLTSTLASAPQKAKEYALEDLALPALGIGLTAYVAYRVLRSDGGKEPASQPTYRVEAEQPYQSRAYTQPPVQTPYRPAPVQPVTVPAQRTAREEQTKEVVKSSFNFATVIAAGKLLIPAAQAIIGVIQNQQTKDQTKEQLTDAQQNIVAEVGDA